MRKPTKAFLETKCEALSVENQALRDDVKRLQRMVSALQNAALSQVRDMSSVETQRQLMARCRRLNAEGVPCKVRQGHIVHLKTDAIITANPEQSHG